MMKKTAPVKIELMAYDKIVVESTDFSLSAPTLPMIMNAILWKNGTTSIISEPTPPLKIEPPQEKTSCEMMVLT
jgi:hypothetical protein